MRIALFIFLLLLTNTGQAQNVSFTSEVFADWIDTRLGDGKVPSYWSCVGEVYSYPDGEKIAGMLGVDMGRFYKVTEDSIVQISRKIFIYTDPHTGEALTEVNGKEVSHIMYPYQQISYVRKNDMMRTWVTQGSGPRIRTIGPGTGMLARKLGNSTIFSAPLFLNFETPRGKYEAYENYDFIYNPDADDMENKYFIIWNRFGDRPAFADKGKGIIQLVANRVPTWDDLPEELKKYIKEHAPMWQDAPVDQNEIKKLQEG